MAPRPYWKGYLKLSLVSCPIALTPATSTSEKISFRQVNKETGHRIRYKKVDAETDEEVANDQIGKGYEVGKDEYLIMDDDELAALHAEIRSARGRDRFERYAALPNSLATAAAEFPTRSTIFCSSSRVTPKCRVQYLTS